MKIGNWLTSWYKGSVLSLNLTNHSICFPSSNMNFVPGEIWLLSNSSGTSLPCANSCSRNCIESLPLLKRRALYWFILALGATPSRASRISFRGLTICTISSIAFMMSAHTSSRSVSCEMRSCFLESLPWIQLCTILFKSRYTLSKLSALILELIKSKKKMNNKLNCII